eukprot:4999827-Pyramimonas_sp.AAC.1
MKKPAAAEVDTASGRADGEEKDGGQEKQTQEQVKDADESKDEDKKDDEAAEEKEHEEAEEEDEEEKEEGEGAVLKKPAGVKRKDRTDDTVRKRPSAKGAPVVKKPATKVDGDDDDGTVDSKCAERASNMKPAAAEKEETPAESSETLAAVKETPAESSGTLEAGPNPTKRLKAKPPEETRTTPPVTEPEDEHTAGAPGPLFGYGKDKFGSCDDGGDDGFDEIEGSGFDAAYSFGMSPRHPERTPEETAKRMRLDAGREAAVPGRAGIAA